jgi:glycosyltransferase involved in cell wall biosynthesis
MPKISVILTSYNHDNYINEAIDSVLNQTFTDFELIIWDDGSSDDSWEIIQSYSDPRIQVFQNPQNKGPVFGINKAIFEIARGKYIAIHHSDDIWELDKLTKQVAFLDTNQDIGAVFSDAQPIDQRGMPLTDQEHFYYNIFSQPNRSRYKWLQHFFLEGNALCHPSILIRKQCYIDCGAYRDIFAQVPDFDMWIRLCAKYEIHVMEDRLIKFRILDGEMNTSGSRPETRIRSANEYYQLLQSYRPLLEKDVIFKIFPDFIAYNREGDTDSDYVLSRVCLESTDAILPFLRQLLAIEILFDILSNPARRQTIETVYGFSLSDFIAITGQYDLFPHQELFNLQAVIAGHDQYINELTQAAIGHDKYIDELTKAIAGRDKAIAERDDYIDDLTKAATGRDKYIDELTKAIAGRDKAIAERDEYIANLTKAAAGHEEYINELTKAVAGRDEYIDDLTKAVAGRDEYIDDLTKAVAGRDEQIAHLIQAVAERDEKISNYAQFIQIIENSFSWRITRPFRNAFGSASPLGVNSRRAAKFVWWAITLQLLTKLRERRLPKNVETIEIAHVELPADKGTETVYPDPIWQTIYAQSDLQTMKFSQFCAEFEKHILGQESKIDFDENFYLAAHPDIAAAVANGTLSCGYYHYCLAGQYENRLHSDRQIERKFSINPSYPSGFLAPTIRAFHNQASMTQLPQSPQPILLILFSHLQENLFFAGYSEFFKDYGPIFELFDRIIIAVAEPQFEPKIVLRYSDKIEVMHLSEVTTLKYKPDLIVGFNAHLTCMGYQFLPDNPEKVVYYCQEFESGFFPYGVDYIVGEKAIAASHNLILSTELLKQFLVHKGLVNTQNVFVTRPKIEVFNVPEVKTKRLFFYYRPESFNTRNLPEDLMETVQAFCHKHSGFEIYMLGSVATSYSFKINGTQIYIANKLPKKDYVELISSCDVVVSMIYSAHPGVIAFQAAASGIPTVTNVFENRDAALLKNISNNIVPYDPVRDSLLSAIEEALTMPKGLPSFKEELYSGNQQGSLVDFHKNILAGVQQEDINISETNQNL